MNQRVRLRLSAVAAGLACACSGAAESATPPRRAGEIEPIRVVNSWLDFELHTAVLTQSWPTPAAPGSYWLSLDEREGGCAVVTGPAIGPPVHRLAVDLQGWLDRGCPSGTACDADVSLGVGPETGFPDPGIAASRASLRLDVFDGREAKGELRFSFPRNYEQLAREELLPDGSRSQLCVASDGRYRRCDPGRTESCCNEGKPLEEVAIPVAAVFCPEAVYCHRPCAADAASCPPVDRRIDCGTACAGRAALCPAWSLCGAPVDGEDPCPEFTAGACDEFAGRCLEDCERTSAYPVFDVSFACFETARSVDDWYACVASCGGGR